MPQQKNRKTKKAALSTQQVLNIRQFVPLHVNDDAYAIEGDDDRLYVYLMLRPDNISVLGRGEILSKIRSLQNVIENIPDMQILCVSSTQSYENNKRYYRPADPRAALHCSHCRQERTETPFLHLLRRRYLQRGNPGTGRPAVYRKG